ncbi:glycosyltransferase family 2 protein [Methylomonas methanica]|uniref:Glycosyl transferase family 2 n=1 Tax=Methylomonas methanica (strain DSM 25384 / MC09) TaxID=857087 RepID=G0A244_METMM|nr:glycosyltransferase family A protein [Methylomonas methanica]AEG02587.1 glycosyl transferase family 2 [Methylomonas methanica MC09]
MDVGVVVIGRNEGRRLEKCLRSVAALTRSIVYVDSGSTDDSVAIARNMRIDVHELDASQPFSAARARNEGFAYLQQRLSSMAFVQFIDGDCELAAEWLTVARNTFAEHGDYAAVVGHLREMHPDASIYNRLCALEWASLPTGDLTDRAGLGGIALVRADVFRQLNGFNARVIAGEERELGVRMGRAGYKIVKLDVSMALHDADIHRFRQWWNRAVRSGHAIGQSVKLYGNAIKRNDVRKRRSILFWGGLLPLVVLTGVVPTGGWSLGLLLGYPLLGVRIYRYCRSLGIGREDSRLYSGFITLSKFPEAVGLLKFYKNNLNGSFQIIEYK